MYQLPKKCRITLFFISILLILPFHGSQQQITSPQSIAAAAMDTKTLGEKTAYRLPILMYHSILPDPAYAGAYTLPPDVLEEDLQYLTSHGYRTITIQDLLAYVDQGSPLPEKPVMLTFDDGYYNNALYLPPLLQQYDMQAVISPVGSFADQYTKTGDRNPYYAMADWNTLKRLAEHPCIELQNHSYALHTETPRLGAKRLPGETEEAYQTLLSQDLSAMQQAMELHCGIRPQAFVYPYGMADLASYEVLKKLGFRASLTCEPRENRITRDSECLWLLGRYNRPYGIATEEFMSKYRID